MHPNHRLSSIRRAGVLAAACALTLLVAAPAAYGACTPPPPQLYAFWPMDNNQNGVTQEWIGNNDGTILNSTIDDPSGYVNRALKFDGWADYVTVDDCSYFDLGLGDFTLLAWVLTLDESGGIVSKVSDPTNNPRGYSFWIENGHIQLKLADAATGFASWTATQLPKVNDLEWTLVAVSVDRDQANGGRFHVNNLAPQTFNPTSRQGDLSNSSDLWIAHTHGMPLWWGTLGGTIDEVMVVRRAMSTSEIQAIFNAGRDGVCRRQMPLLQNCNGIGGGGGGGGADMN